MADDDKNPKKKIPNWAWGLAGFAGFVLFVIVVIVIIVAAMNRSGSGNGSNSGGSSTSTSGSTSTNTSTTTNNGVTVPTTPAKTDPTTGQHLFSSGDIIFIENVGTPGQWLQDPKSGDTYSNTSENGAKYAGTLTTTKGTNQKFTITRVAGAGVIKSGDLVILNQAGAIMFNGDNNGSPDNKFDTGPGGTGRAVGVFFGSGPLNVRYQWKIHLAPGGEGSVGDGHKVYIQNNFGSNNWLQLNKSISLVNTKWPATLAGDGVPNSDISTWTLHKA